MKNRYSVENDVVVIQLQNGLTTTVSKRHLQKLQAFPGKWTADKDYKTGKYYVKNQTMNKGITTTTVLTRFLLNPAKETIVDHINGDTLNNTDTNLREVANAFNSQNQTVFSSHSRSGIRGIRVTKHGKFRPVPMINGTRHSLPARSTLEEAKTDLIRFYDENSVPYIL